MNDTTDPKIAGVSPLNCIVKPESPAVWACLGVDPLDMRRTPYRASKGKRSQYPTMPYHPQIRRRRCVYLKQKTKHR